MTVSSHKNFRPTSGGQWALLESFEKALGLAPCSIFARFPLQANNNMQQQRYESNEKRATLEGTFQEYLCIHFFFVIYPPIFHSGHVFIWRNPETADAVGRIFRSRVS